jgi:16S rRNA (cytosine1402-N4)-methyltransferase
VTTPPAHVPVLLDRCVALLAPAATPDGVLVDATLGLGGHAEALLEATEGTRLLGLDRDPEALRRTGERLARYGERVRLVHAVYDAIGDALDGERADGVLFDLGVSSLQLDEAERGFSYAHDAPLDMRMDPTTGITAADVVNTYDLNDLTRILREYGEERFAPRVARAIVNGRPWSTTAPLAEAVREAIPAATRRHGGHPAKRTFQALRIEVNGELAALRSALPQAIAALRVGGRMVVLAYHSLEDRAVKRAFTDGLRGCVCPPDLPVCVCGREPQLRLLVHGAEKPTDDEVATNPRAASAKLRAVERVREAA